MWIHAPRDPLISLRKPTRKQTSVAIMGYILWLVDLDSLPYILAVPFHNGTKKERLQRARRPRIVYTVIERELRRLSRYRYKNENVCQSKVKFRSLPSGMKSYEGSQWFATAKSPKYEKENCMILTNLEVGANWMILKLTKLATYFLPDFVLCVVVNNFNPFQEPNSKVVPLNFARGARKSSFLSYHIEDLIAPPLISMKTICGLLKKGAVQGNTNTNFDKILKKNSLSKLWGLLLSSIRRPYRKPKISQASSWSDMVHQHRDQSRNVGSPHSQRTV